MNIQVYPSSHWIPAFAGMTEKQSISVRHSGPDFQRDELQPESSKEGLTETTDLYSITQLPITLSEEV
jgi:hypothetical protein